MIIQIIIRNYVYYIVVICNTFFYNSVTIDIYGINSMKKENQKIVTMSFRLSQDLRDRIDKLAEVTKDSPSETVRYAVELYLNEKGI